MDIDFPCRADNAAYPHDGRADKRCYRHDRRADSQCPKKGHGKVAKKVALSAQGSMSNGHFQRAMTSIRAPFQVTHGMLSGHIICPADYIQKIL